MRKSTFRFSSPLDPRRTIVIREIKGTLYPEIPLYLVTIPAFTAGNKRAALAKAREIAEVLQADHIVLDVSNRK